MSDVVVVYPQGREASVRRLRDALAQAGYRVEAREVEGDTAPSCADAGAVLILWDRSTMAHPGLRAVAASARGAGKAVDVSADGITPLGLEDDRNLITLSGWRGEPTHPGWQKIRSELAKLTQPTGRPAAVSTDPAHPSDGRAAGALAAAGLKGAHRRSPLIVAAGALVALLALLALVVFGGRPPSGGHSGAAFADRKSPRGPASGAAVAERAAAMTRDQGEAAVPDTPAASRASESTVPAPPATGAGATGADRGLSPAAQTAPPARHRSAIERRRPAIRYTKYSRTMRLFCARAGRGTRECRIFRAATAK